MTQTPHDTADSGGGQGPRVPPTQMRDLSRLRRSGTDRRIAGVAGGIGRHLDIDPTVIRVLLVVLVFFGGAGLLIYGAVWLFVPEDGHDRAPVRTSGDTRTAVLAAVLVIATLLLLADSWWLGFGTGWPPPLLPLLVIGVVTWLVLRNRAHGAAAQPPAGSGQPPAADAPPYVAPPPAEPRAPRPRALFGVTMAVVLLALGVVAAVESAGTALPWAAYPATALTVLGLALLVGAFVGRSTGLVFCGVLVSLVLVAAAWAPNPRFGDVVVHPVRAELVQGTYERTAGLIHLDLSDVRNPARLDGRTLQVRMRAGRVLVELPDGVDADVATQAQGGRLDVLGETVEGRDIVNNRSTPDTAAPDLRVDVEMGFGHAEVSTP